MNTPTITNARGGGGVMLVEIHTHDHEKACVGSTDYSSPGPVSLSPPPPPPPPSAPDAGDQIVRRCAYIALHITVSTHHPFLYGTCTRSACVGDGHLTAASQDVSGPAVPDDGEKHGGTGPHEAARGDVEGCGVCLEV